MATKLCVAQFGLCSSPVGIMRRELVLVTACAHACLTAVFHTAVAVLTSGEQTIGRHGIEAYTVHSWVVPLTALYCSELCIAQSRLCCSELGILRSVFALVTACAQACLTALFHTMVAVPLSGNHTVWTHVMKALDSIVSIALLRVWRHTCRSHASASMVWSLCNRVLQACLTALFHTAVAVLLSGDHTVGARVMAGAAFIGTAWVGLLMSGIAVRSLQEPEKDVIRHARR